MVRLPHPPATIEIVRLLKAEGLTVRAIQARARELGVRISLGSISQITAALPRPAPLATPERCARGHRVRFDPCPICAAEDAAALKREFRALVRASDRRIVG